MRSYLDMLQYILDNGDSHKDRTGVGTTSVFGYQTRHDLRTGFPLLTTKKMFTRGIFQELVWFLNGRTDNQWLNEKGVKIWDEWSTKEQCAKFGREEGDLGPIYGKQWRDFGGGTFETNEIRETDDGIIAIIVNEKNKFTIKGVDQIKNLITDIQKNPGSRRLIVTGWNPMEATNVALPPCHTLWQCKVTEKDDGKYLDLQLYQRSADAILGVPFNIASYAMINHLISHVCGLIPRYYVHSFGDLHIYNNHIEQTKLQLSREPLPLPTIKLNDRLKGGGFEALLDFKYEDVTIENYKCHDAIKAPVAV